MAHVLLVDDDAATREAMRSALEVESSSYVVAEAADGQVALDILRTSPDPLVVILDALMPGGDGISLLEAVRDDPRLASRHCYLLVTAARRDRLPLADDIQCLLGAPVMSKPFDLEDFLATVARAAAHLPPGA